MGFSSQITRGAITFLKSVQFSPEEPVHDKFLLILNGNNQEEKIYYFFSTSQLGFYNKHPNFKSQFVYIQSGTVEYWPKPTVINCMKEYYIYRDKLLDKYSRGDFEYRGHLPDELMADVDAIIKSSTVISDVVKQKICGGNG